MTLSRGLAVASFLPLLSLPPVAEPSRYWFDDPKTAVEVTTRILATGAPSTYQVVTISIPDGLPRRGEGRVEIFPRKGFNILGTHAWSLPALDGKNKVIGIVGIPASARAGLVTAADVNFSVAGAPMITVAIEIDVSLIRELAVRMQSAPLRVRAGGQVTFSYELVNTGNSTESIETSVAAPKGWKANQRSGSHASVDPDQSAQRQVVVSVPPGVSTGSFFLQLDVLDKGVVRSSIPVAMEIVDGLSRQASAGPEITIAVGRGRRNRSHEHDYHCDDPRTAFRFSASGRAIFSWRERRKRPQPGALANRVVPNAAITRAERADRTSCIWRCGKFFLGSYGTLRVWPWSRAQRTPPWMALDRFGSNVEHVCQRREITTTPWNPRRRRCRSHANDVFVLASSRR